MEIKKIIFIFSLFFLIMGMGNKVFATACYDRDDAEGIPDIYNKGKCYDVQKEKWFEESCKDENTLIEYYCTNSGCQEEEKICPSGYSCSDGACRKIESCSDSDPYKDIYQRGSCEEYSSSGTERFIDTCASDNKTLIEYYCTPGGKKCQSFTFDCSTIGGGTCNNGKCTKYPSYEGEQKCYDSDGGVKPNIAGWCRDVEGQTNMQDSCNNGVLKEYYCEKDLERCIFKTINCPQGCDGPYKCAGKGAATTLEPSKPTGANECCRLSHNLTDVDSVCSKDKVVGPTNPQWCDVNGDGTQDSVDNRTVKWGTCCLLDSIYTVSDWIFIMSFPLSILIFLVAGYFLLASSGDPQKVKNGKNLLIWGVIGLTIVILSKIIPAIIKAIVA
ncbi:MAG TPA: pilin [Candidatus Pacearchaeota archaeon]|nr:pilin [Candidatus Pacearchaeota archaeon]HPZ74245.1 pilin [Candidatus Pacearchaeota archaeon]HQD88975.1 pilin [Candidatus Pacearchaeota archaeon]